MKLNESIMKNLNESIGDFDESSDPVEILRAIYDQYENLNMRDEFFNDILNRSDLSINDLIKWYNMGE